jgi:hypothetical protein
MSDFLVNVVRRGAALPLGMSPQLPTKLDFSPIIGDMEVGVVDSAPSPFAPESHRTELGVDASTLGMDAPAPGAGGPALQETPIATPQAGVTLPSSSTKTLTPLAYPDIRASEATVTAPVDVQQEVAEDSQGSQPPTDRVQGVTPPSPRELADPWPSERVSVSLAPWGNRHQDGEHLGENHVQNPINRGESSQPALPRLEPRPPEAVVDIIDARIPSGEADPQVPLAPKEEVGWIAPRSDRTWESDGASELLHEADAASTSTPESPRIEVRIGRVEIRVTKPPLPAAPASPQKPNGFAEYARARSYRDRKWY